MVKPVILFLLSSVAVFATVMSSSLSFDQRLRGGQPCRKMLGNQRPVGLLNRENNFLGVLKSEMMSVNLRLKAQELENERLKYELKMLKAEQKEIRIGSNAAFSAYLGHRVDAMNPDSTVVFEKTVLNDGGHYNPASGVYKAAEAGVYLFSVFISTVDEDSVFQAQILVGSTDETGAIVNTEHPGMRSQGGNVVIVELKTGDEVSVKTPSGGTLNSEESTRFSTFSGFKIYP